MVMLGGLMLLSEETHNRNAKKYELGVVVSIRHGV
jgi:hypothetical protein